MSLADLFSSENQEKFARKENLLASFSDGGAAAPKKEKKRPSDVSSKGNPKKQRTMSRKEARAQRELANKEKDTELFSLSADGGKVKAAAVSAEEMDLNTSADAEEDEAAAETAAALASASDDIANRTVFAGNIPLTETVKSLTKFFTAMCGKVESIRLRSVPIAGVKVEDKGNSNLVKKVCTNTRKFGEQKGSFNAYIVFASAETAAEAVRNQRRQHKNGIIMGGRHVRLDTTNPPTLLDPKRSVFLGSLPVLVDEEKIREHFAKKMPNGQDDIEAVRLIRDPETLLGKGIGYMLFTSRECVLHALELHDSKFSKRQIRVSACGKRSKNTEFRKGLNSSDRGRARKGSSADDDTEGDNSFKSEGDKMPSASSSSSAAFPRRKGADATATEDTEGPTTLTAKAAAASLAIARRPDTAAKLAFNAANALKRIKTKMGTGSGSGASRKKVLLHNKQVKGKEEKGRKGKRLGGVVKRAMKAAKVKKGVSAAVAAAGDKKKKNKKKPV